VISTERFVAFVLVVASLFLASRGWRASRRPGDSTARMALIWVLIIGVAAFLIAALQHPV